MYITYVLGRGHVLGSKRAGNCKCQKVTFWHEADFFFVHNGC